MRFWDSSAILPLCIEEPHTPITRRLAEEDGALVVWWATPIECCSAFARLRRERFLNDREEAQLRQVLHLLADVWTEIQPSRDVRDTAARLLLLHPLRAADALQLAAALIWAGKNPNVHGFVCLDKRLRTAAAREGFAVLPLDEP